MMPFNNASPKQNRVGKRTLVEDDASYEAPKPAKKHHSSGRKKDEFTTAFTRFKIESKKVTQRSRSLAKHINAHTAKLKEHDAQREKMWEALRTTRDQQEPKTHSVQFMTTRYAAYKQEYDDLKAERDEANVILTEALDNSKAYAKERAKGLYT